MVEIAMPVTLLEKATRFLFWKKSLHARACLIVDTCVKRYLSSQNINILLPPLTRRCSSSTLSATTVGSAKNCLSKPCVRVRVFAAPADCESSMDLLIELMRLRSRRKTRQMDSEDLSNASAGRYSAHRSGMAAG